MRAIVKHILTNALLLWAFAPVSLGAPVTFDDPPPFVRLSDGRIVPYGAGTICSNECVQSAAEALPDPTNRRWLWLLPLGGAIVVLTLLPPGERTPDEPLAPVSESPTWVLLGLGVAVAVRRMRK